MRADEYDAAADRHVLLQPHSGFDATDLEQYVRDGEGAACFLTHDGLTLIAGVWPSRRFEEIRSDVEGQIAKVHRSAPSVADRLRSARREEKWTGTVGVANYFRKPYGSGWALVGDAGYFKDPLTAQGISDAFADAQSLADALDAALCGRRPYEAALGEHHASRDQRVKPMSTSPASSPHSPATPHMQQLAALHRSREGDRPLLRRADRCDAAAVHEPGERRPIIGAAWRPLRQSSTAAFSRSSASSQRLEIRSRSGDSSGLGLEAPEDCAASGSCGRGRRRRGRGVLAHRLTRDLVPSVSS